MRIPPLISVEEYVALQTVAWHGECALRETGSVLDAHYPATVPQRVAESLIHQGMLERTPDNTVKLAEGVKLR